MLSQADIFCALALAILALSFMIIFIGDKNDCKKGSR